MLPVYQLFAAAALAAAGATAIAAVSANVLFAPFPTFLR